MHLRFQTAPVVLLFLLVPNGALAQNEPNECVDILTATQLSNRELAYAVTGNVFDVVTLSLADDQGDLTEAEQLVERMRRVGADDEFVGEQVWSCSGSDLVLESIVHDSETGAAERYDPPLPYVRFPLEAGTQWNWLGNWTMELHGGAVTYSGGFQFTVLPEEVVDTPVGSFIATPIQIDIVIGGNEEIRIRQTDWIQTNPFFALLQRRVTDDISSEQVGELWTLRALSSGGPIDSAPGDTPVEQPEVEPTANDDNSSGLIVLPSVGGESGEAFARSCPEGNAIVGMIGTAGAQINSIEWMCEDRLTSETSFLERIGGDGGEWFVRTCPAGDVMVGVFIGTSEIINRLRLACAPTPDSADTTTTDPIGGDSSTSFTRACPSGMVVVGIRGTADNLVNSIRVVCGELGD